MKNLLLILLIFSSFLACKRDEPVTPLLKSNAIVLSYDSRKCYCLYGYLIKYGNDTILTTSTLIRSVIGYNVDRPIKVFITLQNQNNDDFCKYPYRELKTIELIK